jgi:hypothetical protein
MGLSRTTWSANPSSLDNQSYMGKLPLDVWIWLNLTRLHNPCQWELVVDFNVAQANSTAQQAQRAQGPRQLRPHPLSPICPVQRGENMCAILCEKTSPWDIKISNIVAFMIIVITCTISYNLQALLLDIISLMLFVLVFTYISCSLYIYIIYILYIYII